ncbi:hypothetical protein ACCS93_38180 [Rhizobium ruizarguesonis]
MALPPLRAIKAGQAQLSSTHLQGRDGSKAAAMAAEFFPKPQPLHHIGARSVHRLADVDRRGLTLLNTEVTRTTRDTVSLRRVTSTTYDPNAGALEGPVQLSAGQMTPRAETMLLPPLELSHADYLQRASGSENRLSEEDWERAVEQLQNGYGVTDIAQKLNVDTGQVTTVHIQLMETHLESIAAAPPSRSASPSLSDQSASPSVLDQAAQPKQAIPLSRRDSLETLVAETVNGAQRRHIGKTSEKAINGFNQGLAALNAKPGKEPINASSAQAHYREVAGERRPTPEEVRCQRAELAKEQGAGETAADYVRHRKQVRAAEAEQDRSSDRSSDRSRSQSR